MNFDPAMLAPFAQYGWGFVVFLVVIAIIRGDLVSRKVYADKANECDEWKKLALTTQGTVDLLASTAVTTKRVLDSLPSSEEVSNQ